MKNKEILNLNIQIMINRNLYKKEIIDEDTFMRVNEILLKKLSMIKKG